MRSQRGGGDSAIPPDLASRERRFVADGWVGRYIPDRFRTWESGRERMVGMETGEHRGSANCRRLDHPLVQHHVTRLRAADTPSWLFRDQVARLAMLLAVEATADLPLEPLTVETPMGACHGHCLSARLALVPILRAGLGLVEPVLRLLPEAEVWHLGLYRDESTAEPVTYYSKLPEAAPCDIGLVLDPMLATGGSALMAIAALQRWGVSDIRLLSVIASEAGLERLAREQPQVRVWACAVDAELDHRQFIVPGLGDAGDRMFNTSAVS